VGGLLQTIYAAVEILRTRMPASWEQERKVISNLRSRAEACKYLLDTVQDFVGPVSLAYTPLDLAALAVALTDAVAARYPHLTFHTEPDGDCRLHGDSNRLAEVGHLLLADACAVARREVWVRLNGVAAGEVQWSVTNDGPGLPAEQVEEFLHSPTVSRQGHLSLGMAAAGKLVRLHGGRLAVATPPDGGVEVCVVLPRQPPGTDHGASTPASA